MFPVLFRLPLPAWTIPLFPSLLALAGLGALLAFFGYRKRAGDLLVLGAVVAAAAGLSAFSNRGQVYTLTPLPIYSYGAMLCVSIVLGWFLTLGLAEKAGLPRDKMANAYFVTALAALVGARLLYVATNPQEFNGFRDLFAFRRGGLVAYGGFLGGFLGAWVYLRSQRIRLMAFGDAAAPGLAVGLMITRLGCYLFGCDFGKPLPEPPPGWLAKLGTFPRWAEGTLLEGAGAPAWIQHVNQRGLSPDSEASLPVHPTQLYEALAGAVLLGLVLLARKHQRFRGQAFLAFTLGYGYLRFIIEILRDDSERGELGPYISTHVYLPAALLIFAAAYVYGPSRSVRSTNLRYATDAMAIVPPVALYLLLRPASFAEASSTQLSTSQWIGLLTAVAAGVVWFTLDEGARKHPEAAMSLGPGAAETGEDEAEPSEDEKREPELPPPPPREKKKKGKKKPAAEPDDDAAPDESSSKRDSKDDES